MWKERELIVVFAILFLSAIVFAIEPTRSNGGIGFNSLPLQKTVIKQTSIESAYSCNLEPSKTITGYILTCKYDKIFYADLTKLAYKDFVKKYPEFEKYFKDERSFTDWVKLTTITGLPVLSTGTASKVDATVLKGESWSTTIDFGATKDLSSSVKIGTGTIEVYIDTLSVDVWVTPETAYPYYVDRAYGLSYYSVIVPVTNYSATEFSLNKNNFGAVGLDYVLMADVDETKTIVDGNIVIAPFTTKNFYLDFSTNKSEGKYDFYFYWVNPDGTISTFLIDPYWTTYVAKNATNNMFADWNKSYFVYQRSSDASWEATGELDWNLASRNDTNYTSWKGEYVSDYNLPSDTNLVGLWHLNEITRNDNVVVGKIGNCLNFLGTSDSGVIAASSPFGNSDNFTISFWAYPTSTSSGRTFFTRGKDGVDSWAVRMQYVGTLKPSVSITKGSTTTSFGSNSDIPGNTWTHITITYTLSGNMILYLNGVYDANMSVDGAALRNGTIFRIGDRSSTASYLNFIGKLDSFRVWNRTLSATEVSNIYTAENAGTYQSDLNRTNLTGEWLMDENSNSNWGSLSPDTSGNNNHGLEINMLGAVTPDASGLGHDMNLRGGAYLSIDGSKTGLWKTNAATFNRTTSYFVLPTTIEITPNGTISAWIKYSSATDYARIMSLYYNANNRIDFYSRSTGAIGFLAYSNGSAVCGQLTSPILTNNNAYTHVVATWGNTGSYLYINGTLVTSSAIDCNIGTFTPTYNTIGAYGTGSYSLYWNGSIEEPTLWKRKLSTDEVLALYQNQKNRWMDANLVGYWKFNLASGTTVFDSARGNNGTLTGSGANINSQGLWDTNAFNGNGTSQYVVIPQAGVTFARKKFATISAWVKPNGFSTTPEIYGEATSTAGTHRLAMAINTNGTIQFVLRGAGSDPTGTPYIGNSNTAIPLGVWSYLTIVENGDANIQQIYINGILDRTDNNAIGAWGTSTANQVVIGRSAGSSANYFNGQIDEVKVWDRNLSGTEIQADYNQWMNSKFRDSNVDSVGSNVTLGTVTVNKNLNYNFNKELEYCDGTCAWDLNMVGLWHLNDKNASGWVKNSVTEIYDGNLINGADINGTGLWNTNAGYFNGTNSYINYGDLNTCDLDGNSFTISAWFKPKLDLTAAFLINKGVAGDSIGNYAFRIMATNKMRFSIKNSSGGTDFETTNPVTQVGKWQNATITYDKTARTMIWYFNGINSGSQGSYDANAKNTTRNFIIGSENGTGNFFNGLIEDVAVLNTALSASQVLDLYRKGVSRLDLNIISFSDTGGETPTASVYITDANNNYAHTANLAATYFNVDTYFKQGTGFDGNAGINFVGSYLQDLNLYYYDECHPLLNYDWTITQNQQCTLKRIDLNSGRIIIHPNTSLTLTDCNTHAYDDGNTFFGINLVGTQATFNQVRGCTHYWTTDSNKQTTDCTWWN